MSDSAVRDIIPVRGHASCQAGLVDMYSDSGLDADIVGGFQQDCRFVQALDKPSEVVAHQYVALKVFRRSGLCSEIGTLMLKNMDKCPHSNGPAGSPPQDQRMIADWFLAMLP